jgi:tRNA(Ile)-lysidine synthase
MRTPFEQRVFESIRREGAILPGSRVCVAVSGGADSVALLRVLEALANDLGITLLVAHFNHCLRASESDADAGFVENLTRQLGLRFLQRTENVAAFAHAEGWNLEDAGRKLRRRFFEEMVSDGTADQIAVAHTADDQAETLLAHLMRGTGTTGLGGIYPVAPPVVRPLLETRRAELREYLGSLNQEWREDSTNSDTRRLRARIRENLIPVIEREFSPRIVDHLNDLARFAREEEAFWSSFVEDLFLKLAHRTGTEVRIATGDLLAPLESTVDNRRQTPETPASSTRIVTERLIRRLYEGVRGNRRELSATHVEEIIHLAGVSKSGRMVELPGGIIVLREFDELIFTDEALSESLGESDETTAQHNAYHYVVQLPLGESTIVSVAELGKRFSLNLIDWVGSQRDTIRDDQALDADLLRSPLILRNWRPGDSYRPRGRREERKLKQMLLAERVPASQRGSWPVLESAGQVVWALGMAPAADCSAKGATRRGLLIVEEKA